MSVMSYVKAGGVACVALIGQPERHTSGGHVVVRQVATMQSPRSVHTSTTLGSGHVLLAGGMGSDAGSLSSVELFDPTSNTVRQIAPLAIARASHTATSLPDGRVLIAGGYNGEYLASTEVFDPGIGRFGRAGPLAEGRSGQTATLMPDGRVLFVGGVGPGWTFLNSAELYDPTTGRSEAVGSMAVPRESHTATLLNDGRVLIAGGHSGRRTAMVVYTSAEVYDPKTQQFSAVGSLTTPRHKHDAIRLGDGTVLVVGGADRTDRVHFASTEIFDPGTGRFRDGPTMAERRYKIASSSILLPGGDVLITSGAPIAERLDAARGTFSAVQGRYPAGFRFATASLLDGGDVIIAGGDADGVRATDGVWRYSTR